ncbi:MAG: hypothetical protein KatS3mg027_0945 [Bacteroidia bacterium]|nr:MAG: hypothetical protein KatS3mg027_0945 [Bacteroidia bacterium]
MKSYSAVILSSGKSKRMGFPKALLPFNERETFLSHLIKQYKKIVQNVVIVISQDLFEFIQINDKKYFYSSVSYVINKYPEKGKIYSIQLGLEHLHTGFIFIQNIDNPFVTKDLLRQMITKAENNKYVVPKFDSKRGHPLLIHKSIADRIKDIREEDFNLHVLLNEFDSIDCLTQDPNVLLNINTPRDYYLTFDKEYFAEEWL